MGRQRDASDPWTSAEGWRILTVKQGHPPPPSEMLGIMASPVSLKQGLPLELGRHHEDSEAGRATVGSRVFHFLRGRPGWMVSWIPGAAPKNPCSPLVESVSPGHSTHHVVRLQVPLKLFPEIIGAEIHGCSPMGGVVGAAQRG